MNIPINILKSNPNFLGEFLRHLTFTDKGYGCYENFELRKGFTPFELPENHFLFDDNACSANYGAYLDYDEKNYAFQGEVFQVVYAWDGDGTLIFIFEDFYLVNTDCKKDYEWKLIEIKN